MPNLPATAYNSSNTSYGAVWQPPASMQPDLSNNARTMRSPNGFARGRIGPAPRAQPEIPRGLEAQRQNFASSPPSSSARPSVGGNQSAANINAFANGRTGVYRPSNGAGLVSGPARSFPSVPRPPDPTLATRPAAPPAATRLPSMPRLPAASNAARSLAAGGGPAAAVTLGLGLLADRAANALGNFTGNNVGAIYADMARNEPTIALPNGGRLGFFRYYPPSPEREGQREPYQSPGGTPPFLGGQMSGVPYRVDVNYTATQNGQFGPYEDDATVVFTGESGIVGPIRSVKKVEPPDYPYFGIEVVHGNGTSFNGYPFHAGIVRIEDIAISRLDGQPDTGGNVPGYGTTVQPSPPTISGSSQISDTPTTSPPWQPLINIAPWLVGAAAATAAVTGGPGPTRATALALDPNGLRTPWRPGGPRDNRTPPPQQPPNSTRQNNRCRCNISIAQNLGNQLQGQQQQILQQNANPTIVGSNAAIFAKLLQMQAFAEKAWESTRLQKLINLLTLIGVMHNAAMISREIGETMGYVASNALAVVGIKDEEGNALDVNQLVGESVANFVKSLVGEEAYTQTVTAWQKSNRILIAASNIVWTIRSIHDTTQDVLEWMAENMGKIGNALKKFGVVGERAYPWMSERVRAQDKYRLKFRRAFDGLEQLDDTASSLAQVTSDVRGIQEESSDLFTQFSNFSTLVEDFGPDDTPSVSPENIPIATTENAAAVASQSPEVTVPDAAKGSSNASP